MYSVRGREIVDLREEALKAAEKAADIDLTDRAGDDDQATTVYQRRSAHLPHLGEEGGEKVQLVEIARFPL